MKRRLRRLLALLLVAALLAGLFSCSGLSAPERATLRFMNRLQSGNIRLAERVTLEGSLGIDRRSSGLYRPLFGSMEFAVNGVVRKGNVAHVSLGVTTVDLFLLMSEVSADTARLLLSAGNRRKSDDIFGSLLSQRLRAGDAPTFNYSATVRLVRIRGRWRVDLQGSDGLVEAITGGVPGVLGG